MFCGLHKNDPRAIEDPYLYEEDCFSRGPSDIICDNTIPFWLKLQSLMTLRLVHEGKAWIDNAGSWLVRDGDIEKSKARLDSAERERLRKEADEERWRKVELQRLESEREIAEDEARWAEEERMEREAEEQAKKAAMENPAE